MDDKEFWKIVLLVILIGAMVTFCFTLPFWFVHKETMKKLRIQEQQYRQELDARDIRLPETSDKRDKAEQKKCETDYQEESK